MNTKKTSGLAMVRTAVAAVAGMTCLFAITLGAARAWEINFEGLSDRGNRFGHAIGLDNSNEYATLGTSAGAGNLTATFLGIRAFGLARQRAVLFGIGASSSGGGNQFANFRFAAPFSNDEGSSSPGDVLILDESPADCRSAQGSIAHGSPARAAGCGESDDEVNEVRILDVDGNQIMDDAFYVPSTGGDNKWAMLNFGGVRQISTINGDLSGGSQFQTASFDTTGYNPEDPAAIDIPEPASAPMLVLGLGALAWLHRRYRRG